MKQPLSGKPGELPDPFGPEQVKSTAIRIGLILAACWLVGGLVFGILQSQTAKYVALGIPAAISVVVLGVLVWTVRRTRAAREVASVIAGAQTPEEREAAIEQLKNRNKKNDAAAIFAQAQLEMQEDPKKALSTLESLDLSRVMGPVADEARVQRALIHLSLSQVSLARQLVDNVDIKRAKDPRSRAMIAAVSAETFARSSDAKRALDMLELVDMEDEQLAPMKPQLLRAFAFAYAAQTKTKDLRRVLRQMSKIDVRLLGGFLQGKTHPLLQKEARRTVEQSGAVPRKMQVQRMR